MRAFEYPAGYTGNTHRHRLAQIVYPVYGSVSVTSEEAHITVSPYRAVYVPSWFSHSVTAAGKSRLRSVFVQPTDALLHEATASGSGLLGQSVAVFNISPLLHELIRDAGQRFGAETHDPTSQLVLDLIRRLLFDQLATDGYVHLPTISNPRLQSLLSRGGDGRLTAEAAASLTALSSRQFRRLFKSDTGLTYAQWRSLARARTGIERLSKGDKITDIATDLGFNSHSAFSASFRRVVGMSPSAFAQQHKTRE